MAEGESPAVVKASSNFLTKKAGPLPVWGYAVVLIGAYLIYRYLKDRNASSTSTAADTVGTATNNAASLLGSEGFSENAAGQIVDNATGTIVGAGTSVTPPTGVSWLTQAETALLGLGYSPTAVQSALQNYSAGNPLSTADYGTVEAAINAVGAAPSNFGTPTEASPTPAYSAPTGEQQIAAGFVNLNDAIITDAEGNQYQWVNNPTTANALVASGQTLYFQPEPGKFVAQKYGQPGSPAAGTPAYMKVS